MVTKVKALFGYDDALDAFGVHGAGGTIGALLTGVFAQQVVNPIFGAGKPVGGLDGHWGQLGNQLVGVLIAWGFALVGTIVIAENHRSDYRIARQRKRKRSKDWTFRSTAKKRITWSLSEYL